MTDVLIEIAQYLAAIGTAGIALAAGAAANDGREPERNAQAVWPACPGRGGTADFHDKQRHISVDQPVFALAATMLFTMLSNNMPAVTRNSQPYKTVDYFLGSFNEGAVPERNTDRFGLRAEARARGTGCASYLCRQGKKHPPAAYAASRLRRCGFLLRHLGHQRDAPLNPRVRILRPRLLRTLRLHPKPGQQRPPPAL